MMKKSVFKINSSERKIVLKLTRQGFYFTVLLAAVLGLWRLSDCYKTDTFAEHGLVENLQLATLILSTLIFVLSAIKNAFYRPVFVFIGQFDSFLLYSRVGFFF